MDISSKKQRVRQKVSELFLSCFPKRDLLLEFRLVQWIEDIISEVKPTKIRKDFYLLFPFSLLPTLVLKIGLRTGQFYRSKIFHKIRFRFDIKPYRLMRSLAFNSVENDFCENVGGANDLVKYRVDIINKITARKNILFIQRSAL